METNAFAGKWQLNAAAQKPTSRHAQIKIHTSQFRNYNTPNLPN